MRKLISTFISLVFMSLFVSAQMPNVIISECYHGLSPRYVYLEITNIGTTDADLSQIFLSCRWNNQAYYTGLASPGNSIFLNDPTMTRRVPGDKLAPGQACLIVPNCFVVQTIGEQIDTVTATPSFYFDNADIIMPFAQENLTHPMRGYGGDDAWFLSWDANGDGLVNTTAGSDSILDAFGTSQTFGGVRNVYDIGGVAHAALTRTIIRKANVTHGNKGYFPQTQGTGPEDSEWLSIEWDPRRVLKLLGTAGSHGSNFTFDISSSLPAVTITPNSVTLPWETLRDGIYQIIDFGPNQAWQVIWGPDTLESNLAQNNDTLEVFLVGNDIQSKKYSISVSPPTPDMNLMFPRVHSYRRQNVNTYPDYTDSYRYQLETRYHITALEGDVGDTIGRVPGTISGLVGFGTRADSILFYTEIAPNATVTFVTHDGMQRAHVETGDKFVVKAENGSTHDYFVNVEPKTLDDNVFLTSLNLNNELIAGFNLRRNVYQVNLPADAKSFPDITAFARSQSAKVVIERPVNLRGNQAERTAKIHVMPENSQYQMTYSIVFIVGDDYQPNRLDPIISEIRQPRNAGHASDYEITNVGNVPIDLSDYLIARHTTETAEGIISDTTFTNKVRLGYKIDRTRSGSGIYFEQASNDNQGFIDFTPILEPGDVYTISTYSQGYRVNAGKQLFRNGDMFDTLDFYQRNAQWIDWFSGDNNPDSWSIYDGYYDGYNLGIVCNLNVNYSIWKIMNDSIFNGTKSADEVTDYQLVDLMGAIGVANNQMPQGELLEIGIPTSVYRKPEVFKGNTDNFGSFGSTPAESEWNVKAGYDVPDPYNEQGPLPGGHDFVFSTDFSSTIGSHVYIASKGYSTDETIVGVPANTAVGTFVANIVKENVNQNLSVVSGTSGNVLGAEVTLKEGDILKVTSADGNNHTEYVIALGSLSNDALLTSTVYTITVAGSIGTISGIPSMTSLKEVLANITVPATIAQFSIIDDDNNQVPVEVWLPNTTVTIETPADNETNFEVIAEDGKTMILYSLAVEGEDPFITSWVYDIDQDRKIVDRFDGGSVAAFLSKLKLSPGASIIIKDKYGYEKNEFDYVIVDDEIIVTNSFSSVTYSLNAYGDYIPSNNSMLSALASSVGTLSPSFDPMVMSYDLVVPPGTTSITLTATLDDDLASVMGDGEISLSPGTTNVDVTVTAENGETTTYSVAITISTGIADFNAGSVVIYPNPVASEYYINLGQYQSDVIIRMTDVLGRLVLIRSESSSIIKVNTEALPAGLYFVTISKGDQSVTSKIVKQ